MGGSGAGGGGGGGGGGIPYIPGTGSTRGGSGGGPDSMPDICLTIQEDVRLESPKPEVLAKLRVGDVLELLQKAGKAPITAVTADGSTAGSIVPSSLETLLKCMEQGHNYIATVKSIKGGMCIVQITLARS